MSESRPKNCSHCNAPTSIHLTKVVDGAAAKMGVCSQCPKAKAYQEGMAWDLIDEENGGQQPKLPKENQRACPGCGLTPSDFKEHGRLGCSRCYETFEAKLEPVINKLHRGGYHLGKVPGGKKRVVSPAEIADLKRRLDEHVSREEYEMAAVVRDQIKELGA
ncbi:UvrB/UvrC motif-containing protein [Pelagicoccus enzymogenes]|uniref:UvrB/UvrC motif-containing protein n=1 Tax=Pelagicoccus enzymogenes TaxID=2773457 RepID=UPI002811CF70|nr:UvrB/UvrC motif-containing protein [Pelagicoccus enzymogenes]